MNVLRKAIGGGGGAAIFADRRTAGRGAALGASCDDGGQGSFATLRFRHACLDALAGLGHIVVDDLQYPDGASLEVLLATWASRFH